MVVHAMLQSILLTHTHLCRVKLFADACSEQLSAFAVLRASTKAEVEEAKQKLVEGLKASLLHVYTAAISRITRPFVRHARASRRSDVMTPLPCAVPGALLADVCTAWGAGILPRQ